MVACAARYPCRKAASSALDCLVGFFLDLELDLGAGLVSGGGGGGLAEGGSPPPPAAKTGMDDGDAIRATENSASVASLIADFIMRTSGFSWVRSHGPAAGTDPAEREVFPPDRGSVARCGRLDE